MKIKLKDPVSAITHYLWALAAIPVTVLLILNGVKNGSVAEVVSFSIFGLSLLLLYTMSGVYHSVDAGERINGVLQKLDHIMIFILIAGTYTPVCLAYIGGVAGIVFLILIWVIALIGILIKIFFKGLPRWVSTVIYVVMGWLSVVPLIFLIGKVPGMAIFWLVAGGVIYTVGAVIYGLKWPPFHNKHFGFHELFHLFIMAGTACHVAFMFIALP